jgi:hypothetical protein
MQILIEPAAESIAPPYVKAGELVRLRVTSAGDPTRPSAGHAATSLGNLVAASPEKPRRPNRIS